MPMIPTVGLLFTMRPLTLPVCWRRRGTDRHDSGAAAFWTFWLNYGILKPKGNRIRHNPKKSMKINESCGL